MIKLVACDLDGTLFNSNMTVSDTNTQAVKNAQNNGIEFLIATGRAPRESRSILKDADLNTGFISLNGALVFNEEGKLIVKHSIPTNKVDVIYNYINETGFSKVHYYTNKYSRINLPVCRMMVHCPYCLSFKLIIIKYNFIHGSNLQIRHQKLPTKKIITTDKSSKTAS